MRLLIVEDNRTYAGLLAIRLTRSGFDSDQAHSASLAREAMARLDYAAIILDLGLPDEDGIALLRGIRSGGDMTPVVVVTARSGLTDRVNGWDQAPQRWAFPEKLMLRSSTSSSKASTPTEPGSATKTRTALGPT